jgi:CubicO group peptidase (beta-lactamase class C family)
MVREKGDNVIETSLQNHPFWNEISANITSEMAAQQIPALSLAVLQSGKLLFAQGYGLANLELAVKADEQTVYGLASISKTFAATALMLLVADGQCRLDDGIRIYLPEAPACWNPITLRHLLAHASGLPFQVKFERYGPCEKFLYRLDVTREEFLRAAVQTPLDFAPGTQTQYSNTGYFLLGIIIERISGKSYSQWLASRIFHPLSMGSTRINDPAALIPHRAASYSLEDGVLRNADYTSAQWFSAPNGLVSSVMDMARWDAALTAGQVLSFSLLQQMWEPTILADGKIAEFGLAWKVEQHESGKLVSHNGGGPRCSCYHARFLDAQVSIILLANRGGVAIWDHGKAIAERFLVSEART